MKMRMILRRGDAAAAVQVLCSLGRMRRGSQRKRWECVVRSLKTTGAAYENAAWVDTKTYRPYPVVSSRSVGGGCKIVEFGLPDKEATLGAGVIAGIKCKAEIEGEVLDKSYSPISHPERRGSFELLVKAYPPRRGGGMGAMLCALNVGDTALFRVKPLRPILGGPIAANRWRKIVALGAGTGVAPCLNLVETLLADPDDRTELVLVSSQHTETPVLDQLEASPRLTVFRAVTGLVKERVSPCFAKGRLDADKIHAWLPDPHDPGTLVLVCGPDQFLAAMAGPITRVRDPDTGVKTKIQGPTLGLLGDRGFTPTQVMKL